MGDAIIRRGTTPTHRVTVKGSDISELSIHLTYKCGKVLIDKTGRDLDVTVDDSEEPASTVITTRLSQEETLSFKAGTKCEVQIRAVNANGSEALATKIKTLSVERVILDGELHG